MKIYETITELIGNTPLLETKKLAKSQGLQAKILVKLEYFNPAGSVKDRAALAMIEDAEESGLLKKGSVIIEPTSGNTGIGLASIAAARGYRTIFTMPETMSIERRKLLQGYGAEIVLTEGKKGMKGAIEKAAELKQKIEGAVVPGQFVNPANPDAHYRTTGPGNLGRHRRKCRCICSGSRNRRNNHRDGQIFKRKKGRDRGRCCGAGYIGGTLRQTSGDAWHSRDRGRICT